MKKLLRLLAVLLFLFTASQSEVYAQKKSRAMTKADAAFSLEQYTTAIELYRKAYEKTKNRAEKAEIIFKQAECYRLLAKIKHKQAENYYERAIKAKYTDVTVYLRYADVLKMLGNYNEAIIQYTKYVKLNPTDVRGEMGLKSCVKLIPDVNYRFNFVTCTKLDSLIWEKVNEYRTTEDAITKAYGIPNTITKFGLGDMREYCYDVTKMNAKLSFETMRHSTYEELIPTANGECLYKLENNRKIYDLTDDETLEYLASIVVNGWINSSTHRTVIGWLDRVESTVTTVFHFPTEGGTNMNVTFHAK